MLLAWLFVGCPLFEDPCPSGSCTPACDPGEVLTCDPTEKQLCGNADECGCEGPPRWVPCDDEDCGTDPDCSGADA